MGCEREVLTILLMTDVFEVWTFLQKEGQCESKCDHPLCSLKLELLLFERITKDERVLTFLTAA